MTDPAANTAVLRINALLLKSDATDRTELAAREAFGELQSLTSPEELREASNSFWVASREVQWREPFGDAGVLEYFLELLPKAEDTTLALNAMRILGNSCADKDANRQRLVDHASSLTPLIARLKEHETATIAAVVLYNIVNDYEAAQLAAINHDAVPVAFAAVSEDNADYPCRLLEQLLSKDEGKAAAPESALATAISLATDSSHSFDDRLTRLTILNYLLSTERFQKLCISQNHVSALLDLVETTYGLVPDTSTDQKDKSIVSYARGQLVERIGDISSVDGFLDAYPLDSVVMKRVRNWLDVPVGTRTELQVIGCLVFGNVGRSEEVCTTLVQQGLHKPLYTIISGLVERYNQTRSEAKEKQKIEEDEEGKVTGAVAVGVAHTATGVIKNLAIPVTNKKVLGEDGALDVIRSMLAVEGIGAGQLYYSAVSAARLLIANCRDNAARALAGGDDSLFSLMRARYDVAEEQPTRTEIARTIVAILRLVYGGGGPPDHTLLDPLLTHNLGRPLWDAVLQDKWDSVAQEGWFAMALLSGTPQGVKTISAEWGDEEDKAVVRLSEDQSEERARIKDNCKVLLAEVMQAGAEKSERALELLRKVLEVGTPRAEEVLRGSAPADVGGSKQECGLEEGGHGGMGRVEDICEAEPGEGAKQEGAGPTQNEQPRHTDGKKKSKKHHHRTHEAGPSGTHRDQTEGSLALESGKEVARKKRKSKKKHRYHSQEEAVLPAPAEPEKPPPAVKITGSVVGSMNGFVRGDYTKTTTGDTSRLLQTNVNMRLSGDFKNTVVKKHIHYD